MFVSTICNIFIFFSNTNFCSQAPLVNTQIIKATELSKNIDVYNKITKYVEANQNIEKKVTHVKTPDDWVRSLYYTALWVGNDEKYNNFLDIADNTEVNSITIDIKTVSWKVSFDMDDIFFKDILPTSNNQIKDIDTIIEELHKKNIYIIWRVVVFKDMHLSENRSDLALKWSWDKNKVWTDYSWKKYLDPSSKEVLDYNIWIASAAYEMWFDEINFDYVRFPSDWKVHQIHAPFSQELVVWTGSVRNIEALNNFSKYTAETLKKKYPDIVLSADVFWLVTNWNLDTIGQSLIWFLKYFDYVWPMTYPSHYGNGFLGFTQPDNHPYEIMQDALKNTSLQIEKYNKENPDNKQLSQDQIRLWLQWFSCTRCRWATPYFTKKFKKQTSSIYDNWWDSWWVWNANSNYYKDWYE